MEVVRRRKEYELLSHDEMLAVSCFEIELAIFVWRVCRDRR